MTPADSNLPPVFFNHLYVVLDDKTYRAIQASDFLLSAFQGAERRATRTAAGETWWGTYFYNRENYLEFFGETTGKHWLPGAQEGWAGLAFSTDQPGGVEAVRRHMETSFGYTPFHELRKLDAGQKQVPWFYHVKLAEQLKLQSFDAWVMEYHPEIFAHKQIARASDTEITRRAYLSQWHLNGKKRKVGPVFERISGATVTMDRQRADQFARIMQSLGYLRQNQADQIVLDGNGFALTLRIHSEEATRPGYRLTALHLEMARASVAPMTFVFAPGSRLVLNEDMSADWFFGE